MSTVAITDLVRATNRLNRALLAIRKTSVELELDNGDHRVAYLVQLALEQFERETEPPATAAAVA